MVYDKFGLIKSALETLEKLADAKGILRCAYVLELQQTLAALEDLLKHLDEAHQREKKILQDQIDSLNKELLGEIPEGGMVVGGETCHIDFTKQQEEGENQNGI